MPESKRDPRSDETSLPLFTCRRFLRPPLEMRPIAVARVRGSESVVASGITPGETVVTDGHLRLVPGSRISVKAAAGEQQAAP